MAEPNTSTEFDPHAYIAAMRKAGMPGALPRTFFVGSPSGMSAGYQRVYRNFWSAKKVDPHAREKVYRVGEASWLTLAGPRVAGTSQFRFSA
jgi:hypothetical protein